MIFDDVSKAVFCLLRCSKNEHEPVVVGTFVGLCCALRCSVVTNTTGVTRQGLMNYEVITIVYNGGSSEPA
jgi:hypothetical protein